MVFLDVLCWWIGAAVTGVADFCSPSAFGGFSVIHTTHPSTVCGHVCQHMYHVS
jgi:hypothetical protein